MRTACVLGSLFLLVILSGCTVRFVEPGVYQTYEAPVYYRQPIYSEYYNAPVVYYGSSGGRSHHNIQAPRPVPVVQPTTVYQTITVNEAASAGISHKKAHKEKEKKKK
jgi:hypothetical protein